jgi:hypothetical protein
VCWRKKEEADVVSLLEDEAVAPEAQDGKEEVSCMNVGVGVGMGVKA